MLRITLLCFIVVSTSHLVAQQINFANPSFEGIQSHSRVPPYWTNCGSLDESPPDILPNGTFQVTTKAFDGDTYLGLVTRDNETWESVGTVLDALLERGQCYGFQIALAQSPTYFSVSRMKNVPANFTDPVRLRIWGGDNECDRRELLVESEVISHEDWRVYTFFIQPQEASYWDLVFEVTYPENILLPTNGNLLLDAASPFYLLENCDPGEFSATVQISVPEKETITVDLSDLDRHDLRRSRTKRYLSQILEQIEFDEQEGELADREFLIEGDPVLKKGSPYLFKIQYLLNHLSLRKWELFVHDNDPSLQQLKVRELEAALSTAYLGLITISAYNPDLHADVEWYSKSIPQGLYLRASEE